MRPLGIGLGRELPPGGPPGLHQVRERAQCTCPVSSRWHRGVSVMRSEAPQCPQRGAGPVGLPRALQGVVW